MSNARKQFYRAPFQRARDAARRFMPHRVKVGTREISWRPIVLLWRKRGKHLGNGIICRAAASTKVLSFPQFHLHFANVHMHRSSTSISRESVSSTRVFDTRILREQLPAHSEDSISRSGVRLDYRSPRSSGDLNQSTRTPRDFHTPHASGAKSQKPYATGAGLPRTRQFLFTRPAVTGFHLFSSKQEVKSPFRTQLRVPQYQPLSHGNPSRNQASTRTEQKAETKRPAPPQFYRTEELVWRCISKTTTEINRRVRNLDSIETVERPPVHSPSNQHTAVDVARAIEQVAATPITKLHPALMDRLADDVIRRVEQRVRIERERRGL